MVREGGTEPRGDGLKVVRNGTGGRIWKELDEQNLERGVVKEVKGEGWNWRRRSREETSKR